MTIKEKIEKLRDLMQDRGIDYYIVPTSDPHGSEYLNPHYESRYFMSGFSGSAGTLIVSNGEAALFVDGRYHIQADNEVDSNVIKVYKVGIPGVPNYLQYLKEKCSSEIIGFDGNAFSEKAYERLRHDLPQCEFYIEEDLVDIIWEERPLRSCEDIYLLSDDISGVKAINKINDIKEYLFKNMLDGLFISELSDIMWIFNIRGNDITHNPVTFSYCLITKDSCTLFLQDRAVNDELIDYLKASDTYIASYDEIKLELAKLKGKLVALDKESTSSLNYKILSCGNDIKSINNYDVIKKHIKNAVEIENCRKYHKLDAVSMIKFIVYIKEAVKSEKLTEYDAAMYLDKLRSENEGFKDISFDTICAYKENAAIVHYSPDENNSKILKDEGLLLVDSGAQYLGATTDITRTIPLGKLTYEEKEAYTLVLKGNLRLMDAVFIRGSRGENLDILAREALWKKGLDYMHGTGHGIGAFLNVHEGPCSIRYKISENLQPELEPGMILSDEPGLYILGKFGIRHETQVLIEERFNTEYGTFLGFSPLSLVPFEKEAIILELLSNEEIDILNKYHKLCYNELCDLLSSKEKEWLIKETSSINFE
ncbi:MAG: aminopeptidase P family protein [Lachnospiraceae bacterium]|nr:aminopeptidase P family protein [Lachnospiraceae bacterium]